MNENDDLILPPHDDDTCLRLTTKDEEMAQNYRESLPGLLPDHLIRKLIKITPFAECENRPGVISYGLTSTGYDVRLGRRFKVFSNLYGAIMDPKNVDQRAFHEIETDVCTIPPNSYVLGESVEEFEIPRDITCLCVGKSTYARCGIIVNVTPGEPEWNGRWTIEISNSSPVPAKVYAMEGIMQVLFLRSVTECELSYKEKKGKYQGDKGLQTAKMPTAKMPTEQNTLPGMDYHTHPILYLNVKRQVPENIKEYYASRCTEIPPEFQHFDSQWNLWDSRTIDPKEYE